MIQLQTDADTYEEWIELLKDSREGTIFEGDNERYEKHETVLRFLFNNKSNYTPDHFLGSEEDLIKEGLDIDIKALFEDVTEENNLSHVDVVTFARDKSLFQLGQIKKHTDTWEELKSELAKLLHGDKTPEEKEEYIEAHFSTQQEKHTELLREQADKLENIDFSETPLEGIDPDTSKVHEEADRIESMSLRDFLVHSMEQTISKMNGIIDSYRFQNEPEVGDYAVFQTNPSEAKVEHNDNITQNTAFNIILKLTDKTTTTENGIEIPEFDYDVIAYDDELLDLYKNHFIIKKSGRLAPEDQDRLTFYDTSPLGDIETKVTTDT